MRSNCLHKILITATLLIPVLGAAQGRPPQNGNLGNDKAPVGPTPRTPDGKVDFSGVWDPGFSFANLGQVPLQPWAEALYKERRANLTVPAEIRTDSHARCRSR